MVFDWDAYMCSILFWFFFCSSSSFCLLKNDLNKFVGKAKNIYPNLSVITIFIYSHDVSISLVLFHLDRHEWSHKQKRLQKKNIFNEDEVWIKDSKSILGTYSSFIFHYFMLCVSMRAVYFLLYIFPWNGLFSKYIYNLMQTIQCTSFSDIQIYKQILFYSDFRLYFYLSVTHK